MAGPSILLKAQILWFSIWLPGTCLNINNAGPYLIITNVFYSFQLINGSNFYSLFMVLNFFFKTRS